MCCVCTVQETRWRGHKARELGDGYKLLYSEVNKESRNGIIINICLEKINVILDCQDIQIAVVFCSLSYVFLL